MPEGQSLHIITLLFIIYKINKKFFQMCMVSSKCIVASIVLATAAFLLLLAEHHREYKMEDFVELTLNESHIEEKILIGY